MKYVTQNELAALSQHVGRFARCVESGWLGKVVAVDARDPWAPLHMRAVNELNQMIVGGHFDQHLDSDDDRWYDPADLDFLALV